jgi:hypothetical protein
VEAAVITLARLSADTPARQAMAQAAQRFAQAHRGATERSARRLLALLDR